MDFYWNMIEIPIEFQLDLTWISLVFIEILTGFLMDFFEYFIEILTCSMLLKFQLDF